jgi:nitrous oxidase accessory protein NosD
LGLPVRGINCVATDGLVIKGNTTKSLGNQGVRTLDCKDLHILNNRLLLCSVQGIAVSDSSDEAIISGNIVEGGVEGIYVAGSIAKGMALNVLVSGNKVRKTSGPGISLSYAKDPQVVGNHIFGAGYSAGTLGAIRITNSIGNGDGACIRANMVRPHGAGTEATAAVSIAAGITNTLVGNNDFLGMVTVVSGMATSTDNRV